MRKTTRTLALAWMIGWMAWAAPAAAEEASDFAMQTSARESANAQFTVTLTGRNIKDLYAYEVIMEIDPERLELVEAVSHMEGFSINPMMKENQIIFAHTKIGKVEGDKGDVDIGTLTFRAKKPGTSRLQWSQIKMVDSKLNHQVIALSNSASFTKIFADVATHWAKPEIMEMADKGVVNGMSIDVFAPDQNVTRAQFAALLVNVLKLETGAQNPFKDVEAGAWYEDAVKKAYAAGLIKGISADAFAPEQPITREEMAVMLMRAKAYAEGTGLNAGTPDIAGRFADASSISGWAKEAVGFVVDSRLMQGRPQNQFDPKANTTRAEAAVVMKRLLDQL